MIPFDLIFLFFPLYLFYCIFSFSPLLFFWGGGNLPFSQFIAFFLFSVPLFFFFLFVSLHISIFPSSVSLSFVFFQFLAFCLSSVPLFYLLFASLHISILPSFVNLSFTILPISYFLPLPNALFLFIITGRTVQAQPPSATKEVKGQDKGRPFIHGKYSYSGSPKNIGIPNCGELWVGRTCLTSP